MSPLIIHSSLGFGTFCMWLISDMVLVNYKVKILCGVIFNKCIRWFIYYIPCIHMFKYTRWRIMIFRLNDDISRNFQFFVIILVIWILVHMPASFITNFSVKGNNFVLTWSLAMTTYEIYHPWCIYLKWWVLRTFML